VTVDALSLAVAFAAALAVVLAEDVEGHYKWSFSCCDRNNTLFHFDPPLPPNPVAVVEDPRTSNVCYCGQ